MSRDEPARTPDGRYIVVRGRLWRASDPALGAEERGRLTAELGAARRAVGAALRAGDRPAEAAARARVDAAKRALGERGPVWWTDGAPDLNRHLARTTGYAGWFASLAPDPAPARSAEEETAMTPRDKPDSPPAEPGADILPDTPAPAGPGTTPETEDEHIEDEGEPFGDNFV